MKKIKQKQKDQLIFQILKYGSPYTLTWKNRTQLLQRLNELNSYDNAPILKPKHQSIFSSLINVTSNKGKFINKRVTFLLEDKQKSHKLSKNLLKNLQEKSKAHEKKVRIEKQYNQVRNQIQTLNKRATNILHESNKKQVNNFMSSSNYGKEDQNPQLNEKYNKQENDKLYSTPRINKKQAFQGSDSTQSRLNKRSLSESFLNRKYRYQQQSASKFTKSINSPLLKHNSQQKFSKSHSNKASQFNSSTKYQKINLSKLNPYLQQQSMISNIKPNSELSLSTQLSLDQPIDKNKEIKKFSMSKSAFKQPWNVSRQKFRYQIDLELLKHKLFTQIKSGEKVKKNG